MSSHDPSTPVVRLRCVLAMLSFALIANARADQASPEPARSATQLADRWVEEIEQRFPTTYLASGLTPERHDALDQNAPHEIVSWRDFLDQLDRELVKIPESSLIGRPEWVTWHYMRQGIAQGKAARICRNELWQVSTLGWQTHLMHLAALQPVGSPGLREQSLLRWRSVPAWVEQEIANLRQGLQLGHKATQQSVQAVIAQLDVLLAERPTESAFMSPATRDGSADFKSEWSQLLETSLWPALRSYRKFLRNEYLPRARASTSLSANTDGLACYRATLLANTTVDEDPRKLFKAALDRRAGERKLAVGLGRRLFGDGVKDWDTLATAMRNDARFRFVTAKQVAEYAQAAVDRAAAAIDRMVPNAPSAHVDLEPFPQFIQRSGPGGEYVPGGDDGSRPPRFYFRDDPATQFRAGFEALIFHETLPGHHLQAAMLAGSRNRALHPITRLLWFSGPGEGWATYAETLARELGLYSSEYEVIGALMSSTTPSMVADLGMQAMHWSNERATDYLLKELPLSDGERVRRLTGTITGAPGLAIAYPLGAMQFEQMRATAERHFGASFDVREFHRLMLEDGRLPFAAMRSKLQRWMEPARDDRAEQER